MPSNKDGEQSSSFPSTLVLIGASIVIAGAVVYVYGTTPSKAARDSVKKILSKFSPAQKGTRENVNDIECTEESVPVDTGSDDDEGKTEGLQIAKGSSDFLQMSEKILDISDADIVDMLDRCCTEMDTAFDACSSQECNTFLHYGTSTGTIMILQAVYQQCGFAEWPDVLAVIHKRMDSAATVKIAWGNLQKRLDMAGFPPVPFFSGHLSEEDMIGLMKKLVEAAGHVQSTLTKLRRSKMVSKVTSSASKFLSSPTRENYDICFQCLGEDEMRFIDERIVCWESNLAIFDDDASSVHEEWLANYNTLQMLHTMKPLNAVQQWMLHNYGIGSTLLEEEILHWSTHPVIARLRHLLNETMAGLSAPDPDTDENVIHDEEMGKNHVNVDLHGSKV